MTADFSARYSLREIKSTSDADYAAAISIYVKHTAPGLRTDSNEIAYWLDHYSNNFSDRFYICAFYVNRKVAGFCQFVFLKDSKLVVIDYMAIDARFRGGLHVFFEFVEHMKAFIEKKCASFEYVIVEVASRKDEPSQQDDGLSLMRLLKMSGFGLINATYFQPRLGNTKPDSELAGALMILPKPINSSLSKSGYVHIVRAIYFQHYVRWYSMHGKNYLDDYELSVNEVFQKLLRGLRSTVISVNGLKHFPEPAKTVKEHSSFPFFSVIAILAVILVTLAVVLSFFRVFHTDIKTTIQALIAVLVVFLAVTALFLPRAMQVLRELTKAFTGLFGKTE